MKTGWQIKTLEEVCNVEYGMRVVQKRDGGKGYPVYGGGGATFEMDVSNREDRLVIARFGMSEKCTRYVAGKFFLNDSGLTVSPKNGVMLQQFLDYHMLALNDDIYALGKGTAQKNLDVSVFRTLPLFIPISLAEQQRIVGILDEAFAGIATAKANAEKNLQNARAIFESHLHVERAEKAMFGDLVNIKTGKLDANSAIEDGKYPFFTCSRDIYAIDTYAFDCEAILLAGNNAVGDFNVKHYNGKFNAYQRTYVITVKDMSRVLYRFLYFQMLKSLKKFKAQSVGAGTKFLKLGMIKELEIELPSIGEQQRIVSTTDAMHKETQHLASLYEQKLAALEALQKSLLQQAFSGKL
jgi:type I restriction enzyme S subunit